MKTTTWLCTAGFLLLLSVGCSQTTPTEQKTDAKPDAKIEMTAAEQQEVLVAPGDVLEQDDSQSISQKQSVPPETKRPQASDSSHSQKTKD
jgi:hypothetical protein